MSVSKLSSKQDIIMKAAIKVFSEKGYTLASMDEIAAVAPVSKATLYAHFKDKKNLFISMIMARCQNLALAIDHVRLDAHLDFQTGLKKIAHHFLDLTQSPESLCIMRLIVAETKHFPEIATKFYESVEFLTNALIKYLEAIADKKQASFSSPRRAAVMFFNMLKGEQFIKRLLGLPGEGSMAASEDLIDEAIHLFIQGYSKTS